MSKRPAVSKKTWDQIKSALFDAAWDRAATLVHDLRERPPDDWNDDEKKVFDEAFDVAHRAEEKLKKILGFE